VPFSLGTLHGLGAPFGLTNDGIEQGVGIYIDDVYYSRAASSVFDFLDGMLDEDFPDSFR